MTIARDFLKPFELTDLSDELMIIPNTYGLINELGIFTPTPVSQTTVTIESSEGTLGVLTDTYRGSRQLANKDDTRKLRSFPLAYFAVSDYVTPQDVQGKRRAGSDQAETVDAVVARKLERMRRNFAVTLEVARAKMITTGDAYAPNATISENAYTSFGITRTEVDFVLGTSTTNLNSKINQVVQTIQDNIQSGEMVSGVTVLCSTTFFDKLVDHAYVKESFKYYSSTIEPLRNSLRSGMYRRFEYKGVTFIDYNGSYNGTALIPAGDAYALPNGTTDMFKSFFGPANKFSYSNVLGQEAYAFRYDSANDETITLEGESSFLNLMTRPQAVLRLYSSN